MTRYSDWVTPDPVERAPAWSWRYRQEELEADFYCVGPTYAGEWFGGPVITSGHFVGGAAEAHSPAFARTAFAFGAHDVLPAEDAGDGLEHPADFGQGFAAGIAELHISPNADQVPYPDITVPDGATIEWESPQGQWISTPQIELAWSVSSGNCGAQGSNAVSLCRVPDDGYFILDAARADATPWTPLTVLACMAPTDATNPPYPYDAFLNRGELTAGEYAFTTADEVVCLGISTPEMLSPLTPSGYPLTLPGADYTDGWATGPSHWDLYGVGAQIDTISISAMFQAPRYRFVYSTTGSWRLRQRQSLAGTDSWPLRQRQNGGHSGSWPLRQRQRGV